MVIRVLAVLFTLGLWVGPAQAYDRGTVTAPSAPSVALVESVDDGHDVDIVAVADPLLEECWSAPALAAPDAPPGHQPCVFVFRPPRSYAFN